MVPFASFIGGGLLDDPCYTKEAPDRLNEVGQVLPVAVPGIVVHAHLHDVGGVRFVPGNCLDDIRAR